MLTRLLPAALVLVIFAAAPLAARADDDNSAPASSAPAVGNDRNDVMDGVVVPAAPREYPGTYTLVDEDGNPIATVIPNGPDSLRLIGTTQAHTRTSDVSSRSPGFAPDYSHAFTNNQFLDAFRSAYDRVFGTSYES